ILARLAEASLLLDAGDAKGASAAYEDVKASALGQADGEVRGRALEGLGFAELGKYHQARVALAKGDKAKAIELLKDVQKQVSEPGESHPFSYLQFVVEDRLRELDPTALPPKAAAGMPS